MNEFKCGFCGKVLPKEKAAVRKKNKKNKSGKFFCDHSCQMKYFFPDELRHQGNKTCRKCNQEKPKSDFYFANKEKTRYAVECKACSSNRTTAINKNNPNRVNVTRRYAYGIEPEQYDTMFEKQKGLCAICQKNKKLCVDHNHFTGEIRGLLCHDCNRGLGSFRDNIDFLKRALEYLR
jgi:hypothetical protein